jgi:tight adherence protein C
MLLYLIAVSVALTTGLMVVVGTLALPSRSRAVRMRMAELGLNEFDNLDERRRREQNRGRLREILETVGERIAPDSWASGSLRAKLAHAGYREPTALVFFLGIRITAAVSMFAVGLVLAALADLSGILITIMGLWGWVFGWIIPAFILSTQVKQRQKEIQKALPDALDLLVICVEAGLGLNQALMRVASEMRHHSTIMTDEIVLTNLQIRAGTPRDQAMMEMAQRTGVPDVRSLVTMLVQTERFGTSIARSLRIHADSLRTKRRQRAEEAAAKTTIKLVFPLAMCIFPALFVVILGPAIIQIVRALSGV